MPARQLPGGRWVSKLGFEEDIRHDTLESISGPCHGQVALFLRKRLPADG